MTDPDDLDQPVAFKVSAVRPNEHVSAHKPEVMESQSATKDAADSYKRQLQSEGWIATVTPVFLSKTARTKARNKTQARTAPKGFCRDWRLHGTDEQAP